MKKKMLIPSLIAAIALAIVAVLLLRPSRAKAEESKAQTTEVRIDNFVFTPAIITVPLNSEVTWVNKDDIPHVVANNDGLFKSKALDTDQKYSYTFTKAGTYAYYCSVHPKMVGKIVVQ
jgi:plastocyanin